MGDSYTRKEEETKYEQTSSKYGLVFSDSPSQESDAVSPGGNKKSRALKFAIIKELRLHIMQKQLHGELLTIHTHLKDTEAEIDNLLSQWNEIVQDLDTLDIFLQTLCDENADIDKVNQIIDILISNQNKEHLKSINKYLDT